MKVSNTTVYAGNALLAQGNNGTGFNNNKTNLVLTGGNFRGISASHYLADSSVIKNSRIKNVYVCGNNIYIDGTVVGLVPNAKTLTFVPKQQTEFSDSNIMFWLGFDTIRIKKPSTLASNNIGTINSRYNISTSGDYTILTKKGDN